jgi:hypothetical protein
MEEDKEKLSIEALSSFFGQFPTDIYSEIVLTYFFEKLYYKDSKEAEKNE